MADIFNIETERPLVAVRGERNGYLMLAPSRDIRQYQDLPPAIFAAAHEWATTLEKLGASRVYWITLSEMNPHLHIHLFPRWPEDSLQGIPLFETRDHEGQPAWMETVKQALAGWRETFQVELG